MACLLGGSPSGGVTTSIAPERPTRAPGVTTCRLAPSRSGGKSRVASRSGSPAARVSSGRQTGVSEQRTQSRSFSVTGGRSVDWRSMRVVVIAPGQFGAGRLIDRDADGDVVGMGSGRGPLGRPGR